MPQIVLLEFCHRERLTEIVSLESLQPISNMGGPKTFSF